MKKLLTIAVLSVSLSAQAEFVSGNQLHAFLNGDSSEVVLGKGYIAGVFDAYHGVSHCSPAGVSLGQVSDMTKITLASEPATRNESASLLILSMLQRYWPCAKKGKGV